MALQIRRDLRSPTTPSKNLWMPSGAVAIPDAISARLIAQKFQLPAGELRALSLLDDASRIIIDTYRKQISDTLEHIAGSALVSRDDRSELARVLEELAIEFPPAPIYDGLEDPGNWLVSSSTIKEKSKSNRELAIEQFILIRLENENLACGTCRELFDDGVSPAGTASPGSISSKTPYLKTFERLEKALRGLPGLSYKEGKTLDLISFLREPARRAPNSLKAQLEWILQNWAELLGDFRLALLAGIDMINEETAPRFPPGPGPQRAYQYHSSRYEYEKFSPDQNWMPSVVLLAKNALVWLNQLSKTYGREISKLDQIPEEELGTMADRGINGLWLIGIWQRSPASEKIKKLCGNPDAAASAYSLFDYEISPELGGWEALDAFRERCHRFGIRLAADMVPNHTGIDSVWMRTRPDLFMSLSYCPYPGYTFNGPDLSSDPSVGIWLEDHYYNRSDAAVVFKRLDRHTGEVRYIYHGNDGTSMPWNDTAQIDFLNPEAREAVKERILHVASHFSIIRFDAAMVLAKQHIRRLWYPAPGAGGAIPSRSDFAISDEAFDRAIPNEFWREVVDLCAQKAPDTLLLAEAFWLMEGYFVRTLGMHRVYNSAFMNMLKDEKNSLYRLTVKNTQEFDRDILKRFVNFMSNPDEETAIAQFDKGDKYFGVATMLATMPGLPMIAHGQIEGFTEKYGMEFKRSYLDETPDRGFIARHEHEIFPLFRLRPLFSGVEHFYLFDYMRADGTIDENVFAYSNGQGEQRSLVFYNNHWERSSGRIHSSCAFAQKLGQGTKRLETVNLAKALGVQAAPDNYVIMREIRSGLWYIYRSLDIAERGLSVALEGYQSKVFLNIVNVHDTEGRYARLYEIVDSKGIADLDDALLEAEQPDLFRALHNAISSLSGVENVQELSKDEAIQRAIIFSEMFFSRLCAIAGDDTQHAAYRNEAVSSATLWLNSVVALLYRARPQKSSPTASPQIENPRYRLTLLVYSFIVALARSFSEDGLGEEMENIVEQYHILKKLRECAVDLSRGMPDDNTDYDVSMNTEVAIAYAMRKISRGYPGFGVPAPDIAALKNKTGEILSWAFSDPLMRSTLGVNKYRDIEYFNKERFEALARLLPFCAWIDSVGASEPSLKGSAMSMEERAAWEAWGKELISRAANAGYMTKAMIENVQSAASK